MTDPGSRSDSDSTPTPGVDVSPSQATSQEPLRLAALTSDFAQHAADDQFDEWVDVADPDGVILLDASPRARQRLARHGSVPVLDATVATASPSKLSVGPGQVSVASTTDSVREALDEPSSETTVDPHIVVTSALELQIDTTALSTQLVGRAALETATPPANRPPVVLSTAIPDGFRNTIEDVLVIGVGEPDDPGESGLGTVEIPGDGTVLTGSIDPDRLGLRALTGVGATRAETLRQAGFDSRGAVAEASMAEIQDLPGLGVDVAETIMASATAIARDEVHLQSRRPIQVTDPLFVDIETDGLNPTITWLVGVLDGGSDEGTYHSFVARDPTDPGRALEAFLDWYESRAAGRPLVAYNGRRFDFPVIRDHLQAYRPKRSAAFDQIPTFDPYAWAVTDGNAMLPGRTNRLEDVAAALGYEKRAEGVTGAAVARAYRAWMNTDDTAPEPAWDRFDRYCEDDTRALATVFKALEEVTAAADSGPGTQGSHPTQETTQGTLGDW